MEQHEIVCTLLMIAFVVFCLWRPKPEGIKDARKKEHKPDDLRPWQDW